ncbi:cytochrome-c peroxidase [Filimonas lacunae]|nr:cytochrome c peroxidase [Filimonas lacunae]BAV05592.1 cytochrome c551 peroxidase [Filimonas lacunae]
MAVDRAVFHFRLQADSFATAAGDLYQKVLLVNEDSNSVIAARKALVQCRLYYKRIEYFLAYFFFSESTVYNAPPKYEIEEPYMEYQHPAGLQVIEALLYEDSVWLHRKELNEQAELVSSSASALSSLLYGFKASDAQLLESMRLELVRVIALHISGYDAPLLKSGVAEAAEALTAFEHNLLPFTENKVPYSDSVAYYVKGAIRYLHTPVDFDSFNRLYLLRCYLLPLQRCLGVMIAASGNNMHSISALSYKASHLFSADALDITAFDSNKVVMDSALVSLGRQLFAENALSGNQQRSCISCHKPDAYFADGLARSQTVDGRGELPRNTPTLLYSGYQHAQFWDGRASSLEKQVRAVMLSKAEMNADTLVAMQRLQKKGVWQKSFKKAFPAESGDITMDKAARAIAAYVRTLAPFNSPFDRYIQGDTTALTANQQWGFNLFMGKAQCGSCHFAPLFNGLTPPLYQLTEFEVLGTTATDAATAAIADTDNGRYDVFPISFYKQAFKTPTVRNAAVTGPYMHNGRFPTLESVIEFYDKGGGEGLGVPTETQTLATTPLHLTDAEKKALVAFMEALTDSNKTIPAYKTPR